MTRPGSKVHWTEKCQLTPAQTGQLRAIDYNERLLTEVPYASIATAGEARTYGGALAATLARQGVLTPIVVFKREGFAQRLVDGHHRARFSHDALLPVPAEIHYCSCAFTSLDYFGLCPPILQRVEELKHHAI